MLSSLLVNNSFSEFPMIIYKKYNVHNKDILKLIYLYKNYWKYMKDKPSYARFCANMQNLPYQTPTIILCTCIIPTYCNGRNGRVYNFSLFFHNIAPNHVWPGHVTTQKPYWACSWHRKCPLSMPSVPNSCISCSTYIKGPLRCILP